MPSFIRTAAALGCAGLALAGATTVPAAGADSDPGADAVERWVARQAHPLHTTRPSASLRDLAPLADVVDGAAVVGLGEATHGTREITALKHRAVRYLVREQGFRTLAWEDDWSLGLRVDRWVRGHGRPGDVVPLVREMSTAWHSRDVVAVLRWLRRWNEHHAARDRVSFVGVEYYTTRPFVYDLVGRWVADVAPDRLRRARAHLRFLEPFTSDMGEYVQWYLDVTDKRPYLSHSRELLRLVSEVASGADGQRARVALQAARQIRAFHVGFSLDDNTAYRDRQAARTVRWARATSGDRVVYWAAAAHTANAPTLRFEVDGQVAGAFPSAGSHLRTRLGSAYRSIGFTLDRGAFRSRQGVVDLPSASSAWFESAFADGGPQFLLDLHAPAPAPVRRWLEAPVATRGLPELGLRSQMTGGSLAEWFDAVVHRQVVGADRPLVR